MMENALVLPIVLMAAVLYQLAETIEDDENQVVGLNPRFLLEGGRQFTGWASWEQFAACSTTCAKGYEKQTRDCCDTGSNMLCYTLPWDTLRSYIGTCTVDGVWSAWSHYSACTLSCGGGTQYRNRTCNYPAGIPHGTNCPGYISEMQDCNTELCPVDGVWSAWSQYSACTVSCGGGTHYRNRTCYYPAGIPHGRTCPGNRSEVHDCNTQLCPVNGSWSEWRSYGSKCSVSCGDGVSTRFRTCTNPKPSNGGLYCPGDFEETIHCTETTCPVDGFWSAWSQYSACTQTCGGGTTTRTRNCVFPVGIPHGEACHGSHNETNSCNTALCPGNPCYSCNEVGNPKDCVSLDVCQSNEVCYIQQSNVGGHDTFHYGCRSKLQCTLLMKHAYDLHRICVLNDTSLLAPGSSVAEVCVGPVRSTNLCFACCGDIYCNYGSCRELKERIFRIADAGKFDFNILKTIP